MKAVKVRMGMMVVRFIEEEREWRLPCILYADDFALCSESKEDLKVMVGRFVEMCRERGFKIIVEKFKVMVLGGKEGLECEIRVDGVRLEQVKFKYLGCVLGESGTYDAECPRLVESGRKYADAIRSLVNVRSQQL